jgi:NCAIR mutase (PurE)-related protein
LNSCGSGVTVVNIDNGFGAGYAASQINQLAEHTKASRLEAPHK